MYINIEETPGAIESSVQLICQDEAFRRNLERGAREYYLEYLSPVSVINRILNDAESIDGHRAASA